jgi:hypothetical protein
MPQSRARWRKDAFRVQFAIANREKKKNSKSWPKMISNGHAAHELFGAAMVLALSKEPALTDDLTRTATNEDEAYAATEVQVQTARRLT